MRTRAGGSGRSLSRSAARLAAMLALLAGSAAALADGPAATPYRPTVSNPAALSAAGLFELEAGWLKTKASDGQRRDGLPWLLKYAFSERLGLLVGGEGFVWQRTGAGESRTGGGDTSLTFKFSEPLSDSHALGLELGAKLPTAGSGLGSGSADYTANGIYSADIAGSQVDLNLNYTRLGTIEQNESRGQYGWAAAISLPLAGPWGAAFEVSGAARKGTRAAAQLLAALSYSVSRRVVVDAGIAWGLARQSPDLLAFTGLTILFE